MALSRTFRTASLFAATILTLSTLSASAQNEQPVRVVIVGLEHGHVDGFLHAFPRQHEAELVGIVDPDQALCAKAEKNFHLDHSLFYNTLDVMVEKPLTLSVEDALAIRKVAREHHIQVLVNYETTWYSSNKAVMDMVQQGKLGDVRKVVVHDGHQGPAEIGVQPEFLKWLTDPAQNGAGALYDFGCYGADLMTVLMHGEAPISVTAVAQTDKPETYPHADDDATIILHYKNAQAVLMPSWDWTFARKDMEVYGTKAYAIAVNPTQIKVRTSESGSEEESTATPLTPPEDTSLHYLAAVVRHQLQPDGDLTGLDTNMVVMQILDAARHSAAEGKTIQLHPLPN
jgi:glucose-fructose oxidoreductase